jgi:PAS domain S-box-containing protein
VAIKQDISERVRTEHALAVSQRRLAHAAEAGGIGLWDWDVCRGAFDYTDEWCRLIGCERRELAGVIDDWFSRLHPDDAGVGSELRAMIDNHPADDFTREFRLLHKDGSYRWFLSKIVLQRDGTGRVIEVSGANMDITERKRLEEEYRQAQKLESIGRLAGGIAHDFNNLLSVIGGYTEMAMLMAPEDGALRRDLEHVKKAADRAASLTRQLLAFSRRQVLRPESLNLTGFVRDTEAILRRLVGEDIVFNLELREMQGCILADPGQIEQVLMNLVVNARDAMPYGGTLTIKTDELKVVQELQLGNATLPPGEYVVLAVADTGTGMDAKVRQHLFEPFFTTKEQGKGTGLGLATVYGIVRQSGGAINVESAPGEGTEFAIYLPQVASSVTCHDEHVPETSTNGTETILLVEDDAALRELTQRILSILGYQVIVAESGQHALELAEQFCGQIALLLTDVVMPGMSGAQLARQLGARYPGLRILYMSGYTDDAIVQHGVLSPGTHLINKPFTPMALGKAIRELLDKAVVSVA